MDNLSKPELLTLLSIMEGELEARDLVIEALRVSPTSALIPTLHQMKGKSTSEGFSLARSGKMTLLCCRVDLLSPG